MLRDNNQNELFFADKVIVCEGFDEYVIKAAARELFHGRIDAENVSVIAVNGKDNIAAIVGLILQLGLECYILCDFDYLLRDKSEERKQYNAKAHDSVASLPQGFFEQPTVFADKGKEVLREISSIRAKVRNQAKEAFFTAKQVADVRLNLRDLVASLRKAGVGILDGEIESLSTDSDFLSATSKLGLDKVYQLRGRLIAGEKFSSFMDLSQLREFLSAVFDHRATATAHFDLFQKAAAKVG